MATWDLSAPVSVEFSSEGAVNGIPMNGSVRVAYDPATNVNGGVIRFRDNPDLGNVMLTNSCTCHASVSTCIFSRPTLGSKNLVSVIGVNWEADSDFVVMDPSGTTIGQFHQHTICEEAGAGHCRGRISFHGWHNGPTSIYYSPGYAILLRQVRPRLIEGVYGQVLFYDGGEAYVFSKRTYAYHTDETLPFDEVWHYKLLSLDVRMEGDDRLFDYRATAFYSPAEAEHGAVEAFTDVVQHAGAKAVAAH